MANPLILPGYPAPPGSKKEAVSDVSGPASYTQITLGATISGGQALTPQQLGIHGLIEDVVSCADSYDSSGNYYAVRRFLVPIVAVGNGRGASKVVLQWLKNGSEVSGATNLSTISVRLLTTSTSY